LSGFDKIIKAAKFR